MVENIMIEESGIGNKDVQGALKRKSFLNQYIK